MKIKEIRYKKIKDIARRYAMSCFNPLDGETENEYRIRIANLSLASAFDWYNTKEGFYFWEHVNNGNYKDARKIYDWDKERPKVITRGKRLEEDIILSRPDALCDDHNNTMPPVVLDTWSLNKEGSEDIVIDNFNNEVSGIEDTDKLPEKESLRDFFNANNGYYVHSDYFKKLDVIESNVVDSTTTVFNPQPHYDNSKPEHYSKGIDTFKRMEVNCTKEECLAFAKGNIDKYNWRTKGQDLEDFKKIISYAEWAIKLLS